MQIAMDESNTVPDGQESTMITVPGGAQKIYAVPGGAQKIYAVPGGAQKINAVPGGAQKIYVVPGGAQKIYSVPGGAQKKYAVPGGLKSNTVTAGRQKSDIVTVAEQKSKSRPDRQKYYTLPDGHKFYIVPAVLDAQKSNDVPGGLDSKTVTGRQKSYTVPAGGQKSNGVPAGGLDTKQKSYTVPAGGQKSNDVPSGCESKTVTGRQKSSTVPCGQKSYTVPDGQKSNIVTGEKKSDTVSDGQDSKSQTGGQKSTSRPGGQKYYTSPDGQKFYIVPAAAGQKSITVSDGQKSNIVTAGQKSKTVPAGGQESKTVLTGGQESKTLPAGGQESKTLKGGQESNVTGGQKSYFVSDSGGQKSNAVSGGQDVSLDHDHPYSASNTTKDLRVVETVKKGTDVSLYLKVVSTGSEINWKFELLKKDLKQLLFSPYVATFKKDSIEILELYKLVGQTSIKLVVAVSCELQVKVYVHRKEVPSNHYLWNDLPKEFDTFYKVSLLLHKLQKFAVCMGNPDEDFQSFIPIGDSFGDQASVIHAYREGDFCAVVGQIHYHSTIRSADCQLLVQGQRCNKCILYRRNLVQRKHRLDENSQILSDNVDLIRSKRKHCHMSKEVLVKKIKQQQSYIKTLQYEIERQKREFKRQIKAVEMQIPEHQNVEMLDINSCQEDME